MRTVVVKVGGASVAGGALEDLPGVVSGGARVAVVHGGGRQLTRMLDSLGVPTSFREGLRVTDERTLEVAEMVFAGSVNKQLARGLLALGVPAAGVSGTDGPVLRVEPVPGLGRVGRVVAVETRLLETLWGGGFVPVVAPLGLGPRGAYNVNADDAAAALAVALGAGELLLLTDVDGLLRDDEPVPALTPAECERYVSSGVASGGMAPKLRAAAEAARGGVPARIINGGRRGALAGALAGGQVGTLVRQEGAFA
ncbi:N-acetylglutamate kinase [Rubrobacter xylanophilus DSM 9941]|uniref:Acetylglutamate kinase n=1 Tax=Rubrobacter xylanophilus (strain DSM 9941 / JCM 11954 / NBRC 16129 / PRD-1) TaxID=266117 RepID=ARGB_RUBXD|nr:acetylglutamate kinase [Rubrobacter xylanophilus]Q1AS30.1 RecName: Full=Acetylglutamate kinase; AltName: Full=N-acetyl-L-glutamate 5-phosphotransferase; AltName: Full=NAG kinase; Short=NAGK [Rubrobacter xylanophilus DSM 9941]ABG05798.1 N-acetylglutamate kinase [Rubrobacter xylanophilus DSM 9941]